MRFSGLQKFILIETYLSPSKTKLKADFEVFYKGDKSNKKSRKIILDAIHGSIDSLVIKDLLVAYGRKTAEKWFVEKVKLTAKGKKIARELILKRQSKLPLR